MVDGQLSIKLAWINEAVSEKHMLTDDDQTPDDRSSTVSLLSIQKQR